MILSIDQKKRTPEHVMQLFSHKYTQIERKTGQVTQIP